MNIKDYFSFTRGEKRGVVVILLIIAVLIIANLSVDLLKQETQINFSEFEKEIQEFEKGIQLKDPKKKKDSLSIDLFEFNPNTISDEEWKRLGFKAWQIKIINKYKAKGGNWKTKNEVSKIYGLKEPHFELLKPFILLPDEIEKKKSYSKEKSTKIEYFKFDPNTISKEEWKLLGFVTWQIKTIFNYKSKGGSWKSKADFKKIYGLKEVDYLKLEPYLLLPEITEKKEDQKNEKDYRKKIDVNSADVKEMTNLKGVRSEKYAAIIIKHRDELGGFIAKEQLKEVWNMTDEIYNGFIDQVVIGQYEHRNMNINSSTASQLQKHPYIDWKTANAICKYRKANGNYKKIEDLKKIHLISNETYLKIAPYLTIE
jgi:competence protein ComEA